MPSHPPACYGALFPDLARLEYNRPCRGQAFVAEIRSQGLGVQSRELKIDRAAWAACTACPDYRSCYDLCLATLLLRRTIESL